MNCVYCGTERHSANGTGSDVVCCGEQGHMTDYYARAQSQIEEQARDEFESNAKPFALWFADQAEEYTHVIGLAMKGVSVLACQPGKSIEARTSARSALSQVLADYQTHCIDAAEHSGELDRLAKQLQDEDESAFVEDV